MLMIDDYVLMGTFVRNSKSEVKNIIGSNGALCRDEGSWESIEHIVTPQDYESLYFMDSPQQMSVK